MSNIYDDVELLKEQMETLIPVALTEGADIHALPVGRYYIPDTVISATILNKPVTRNSNAYVDVRYGATGEKQVWYYINSKAADVNNKVYYCYFYDNEWSEWLTAFLRPDDSGWLDLPLASGITAHNASAFPCRYRKVGNMVFVEGCVKGFAEAEKIVATIPEGFRPSKSFYVQGATNGGNTDTFNVQAVSGQIQRVSTTLANLAADNYHFINMSYLID